MNTQTIGGYIGEVAAAIQSKYQELSQRIIGHSLGAHVAGKAARSSNGALKQATGRFQEFTKLSF